MFFRTPPYAFLALDKRGMIAEDGRCRDYSGRASNMSVAHIKQHPELTPEAAMEIFRKHFENKYEVNRVRGFIGRQFVVQKISYWGVLVGVKQEKSRTTFVYHIGTSSLMLAFILSSSTISLESILMPKWEGWTEMEWEIESFIRNAPEFK